MMRVEHLTYRYGQTRPAVSDISFELKAGERLAVVGANGSGKSTLLRLICGLLAPQSGRVWVADRPVETLKSSQRARLMAILFQNPDDQIFKARVADELRFAPLLAGMAPGLIETRMHRAVSLCGVDGTLDKNPYDLTRAQRKRVCLASVLMMETPLVLLDEPMSGQDPAGRGAVMRAMDALAERGASVVTVTHDMAVAAGCDRLVLLDGGCLTADGPPRVLFGETIAGLSPPDAVLLGRRLGLPGLCLTEREVLDGLRRIASGQGLSPWTP